MCDIFELQEQEQMQGRAWLCLWGTDWVVSYWWISCEWQVIAPPSSSEKRCCKRKLFWRYLWRC